MPTTRYFFLPDAAAVPAEGWEAHKDLLAGDLVATVDGETPEHPFPPIPLRRSAALRLFGLLAVEHARRAAIRDAVGRAADDRATHVRAWDWEVTLCGRESAMVAIADEGDEATCLSCRRAAQ